MKFKVITVRVPISTHLMLKELALSEKSNVSELSREILIEAMRREKWQDGKDPILEDIRKILLSHTSKLETRLTRLMARGAIDAGTIRRLVVHLLVKSEMHSQDEAQEIDEEAYDMARKNLHNPLEAIDELMKLNRET